MSTNANIAEARDPICGMAVDPAHAAARTTRDGKTYHFCSTACKARFDAGGQPEAHLCCRRVG
ncbi:MAG TPA: YHS domain-containing protein [Vicinamibacteria bacterium]|nr:YHS domain-containing protein [Vicinamibacteria bacterium]